MIRHLWLLPKFLVALTWCRLFGHAPAREFAAYGERHVGVTERCGRCWRPLRPDRVYAGQYPRPRAR